MTPSLALILEREQRERDVSGGGRPRMEVGSGQSKTWRADYKSKSAGEQYRAGRRGKVWGQRPGRSVSIHGGQFHVVSKSRYVRIGQKAKSRLGGALNYFQNRERAEFEPERKYFTKDKEGLDRFDIKDEIEQKFGEKIAYHSMVLSSGDNSVDPKLFTKEVMREWEERLGYELDYWAVAHYNTDHYHTHVIIAGKVCSADADVRFDREAFNELREVGNDYLARERMLDRELDREVERELLKSAREYDLDVERNFKSSIFDLNREELNDLGLRSDAQNRQEMRELGLGAIYELGKPFENIPVLLAQEREIVDDLLKVSEGDSTIDSTDQHSWDKELLDDLFANSLQDMEYYEAERVSASYDERESTDKPGPSSSVGPKENGIERDEEDDRERDDDDYRR